MRAATFLLACLLFVAAPTVALSAQEGPQAALVAQGLDVSAFPEVAVTVTLPLELYSDGAGTPEFSVSENGEPRDVLSAEPLRAERAPVDVVLLLDTSGSMRGAPMDHARDAAIAFIEMMSGEDAVSVVAFASDVTVLSEFSSDKTALRQSVGGLEAGGETALYDGVRKAADLFAGRTGRDAVIVLLTDGGDTVSVGSLDDAVTALEGNGIPLLAVGLQTSESDTAALATLAARARGRMVGIESSVELEALYGSIAREITTQFKVVYESAVPSTKELETTILAQADGQSASVDLVFENPYFAAAEGTGEGVTPASPAASIALAAATVLLAFASIALAAGALLAMLFRNSDRVSQLAFYDQLSQATALSSPRAAGVSSAMQDVVASVAGRRGFTKLMHEKLERAGLPLRPVEYMYFHVIGVVALGVLTQVLVRSAFLSFLVVLLAVALPILLLEAAIDRRRRAFEEMLPEILSLMAGSLRSGWGVQQAIDLVVQEMGEPAASEFRRVQAEARLGLSVEEALGKMAERLGSDDFRWTVTAIAIQRDVGGNLAEVLDVLANTMRERAELRRHVKALTSEGRFSAIILFLLPFVMMSILLVINPGYISPLLTTALGLTLLGVGVILLVIGAFWLRQATRVEV